MTQLVIVTKKSCKLPASDMAKVVALFRKTKPHLEREFSKSAGVHMLLARNAILHIHPER